ncbi:hypothetical protein PDUR_27440 [Paenibacillus durus]|uniref:Uncharacterized protein n=1 Tax=Paenibacillus durus TaxID=44251 RepID=A0A089HXS2_PAEDU|nr:hypothetical protein PDUR_27440 [Paenibacillus durus]
MAGLLLCGRYEANSAKLERMAAPKIPYVHLETVEEAKNEGAKPEKAGHPGRASVPMGNTRLGYWRVAGSPVLSRSITNEKLAQAGYYDFPAQYERLRQLHSNG